MPGTVVISGIILMNKTRQSPCFLELMFGRRDTVKKLRVLGGMSTVKRNKIS